MPPILHVLVEEQLGASWKPLGVPIFAIFLVDFLQELPRDA